MPQDKDKPVDWTKAYAQDEQGQELGAEQPKPEPSPEQPKPEPSPDQPTPEPDPEPASAEAPSGRRSRS